MPRSNYSLAMQEADQSPLVRPAFFASIGFRSETAYLWTGIGTYAWNGYMWQGAGLILSFSAIEEGSTVQARGIVIGISGLSTWMLGEALNDYQIGLPVQVYRASFDGNGNMISSPVLAWGGRTDKPSVSIGAETSTLQIACETRLIDANVAAGRRRSSDDFTQITPGDLAGSFVSGIQSLTIQFGNSTISEEHI